MTETKELAKTQKPGRDKLGRFAPGGPGGPGRPPVSSEVKRLFRQLSEETFPMFKELARAKDRRIRLEALKYINDRAWGRPTERVGVDEDALPINYVAPTSLQLETMALRILHSGDEGPHELPPGMNGETKEER